MVLMHACETPPWTTYDERRDSSMDLHQIFLPVTFSSRFFSCVAMADRVSCPGASFSSTRNHPQHLRSRGRQKKTGHVSRGTHRPGRRPSTTAPLDPVRVGQFVIITTAYCTNITIVRSNVRGCDWKTDRPYVEYPIGPDAEAKSDSPTPLVQLIISQLLMGESRGSERSVSFPCRTYSSPYLACLRSSPATAVAADLFPLVPCSFSYRDRKRRRGDLPRLVRRYKRIRSSFASVTVFCAFSMVNILVGFVSVGGNVL
ncbi:hypothetical protein B296_00006418 [Ensete ventricosum]|uniref:Uncharacterized protein n=1 Tax=Ensete ventricosum TaxID=4639 RepID=A0A426Z6Z3_ENSVE|nr:hypothetical protein B296_00006418 [Ensete ventricosum]